MKEIQSWVGGTTCARRMQRLIVMITCSVPVAAAAAPGGVALVEPERTQIASPPVGIKDFELTNHDGRPFRFSDLQGHSALVFFGFTNCPNVCPPTLQLMRQVKRSLQEEDLRIEGVLVSVDGERDTPAAMKAFLAPFDPEFIGLTGDPRVVRDISAAFSAVFFKGMPTDSAGGYNVEHTSQVYLVDGSGRLRATFYNAPVSDMVAVSRFVATDGVARAGAE